MREDVRLLPKLGQLQSVCEHDFESLWLWGNSYRALTSETMKRRICWYTTRMTSYTAFCSNNLHTFRDYMSAGILYGINTDLRKTKLETVKRMLDWEVSMPRISNESGKDLWPKTERKRTDCRAFWGLRPRVWEKLETSLVPLWGTELLAVCFSHEIQLGLWGLRENGIRHLRGTRLLPYSATAILPLIEQWLNTRLSDRQRRTCLSAV